MRATDERLRRLLACKFNPLVCVVMDVACEKPLEAVVAALRRCYLLRSSEVAVNDDAGSSLHGWVSGTFPEERCRRAGRSWYS